MLNKVTKVICAGVVAATLFSVNCFSQDRTVLKFDSEICDLGTISESDGIVSHVFTFTNTSDKAVVIERVNSDCGCTVPKYSTEPVRPAGQGTVEVAFNPAGYEGPVSKTVSVFSNAGRSRNTLTIRGNVVPRERTVEERFPYRLSDALWADRIHVPFDYVSHGSTSSMVVEVVNASNRRITLGVAPDAGSGRLKINLPSSLAAGQTGYVTLTYDLTDERGYYGTLGDDVTLLIDGVRSKAMINARATVIDDFSHIDPAHTPGCYVNPVFHNFRQQASGSVVSKEFTISNSGTETLIIRKVEPRHFTRTDLAAGTKVAPGKSLTFTLSMTVPEEEGVKTGGIMLITNNPDRPMRELRLAVESVRPQ